MIITMILLVTTQGPLRPNPCPDHTRTSPAQSSDTCLNLSTWTAPYRHPLSPEPAANRAVGLGLKGFLFTLSVCNCRKQMGLVLLRLNLATMNRNPPRVWCTLVSHPPCLSFGWGLGVQDFHHYWEIWIGDFTARKIKILIIFGKFGKRWVRQINVRENYFRKWRHFFVHTLVKDNFHFE